MQKIENFECGFINEKEQISHKLLEEKFFVIHLVEKNIKTKINKSLLFIFE